MAAATGIQAARKAHALMLAVRLRWAIQRLQIHRFLFSRHASQFGLSYQA
jgi:hypothetical protein